MLIQTFTSKFPPWIQVSMLIQPANNIWTSNCSNSIIRKLNFHEK